ncbi:hypothetical protein BN59_02714 [Legionella massiliensis]|uniref:Uncharacterized protein n=1 Tax=Legionella massiliensis TaxID=1034943 RepID=A0A078L2Q9_9GAMM|nr:hypothetical protein BN59_02714 [Legionella massiliensis]CEE14142.1 hypothetical protein BN1094_02714 [Legionella massiliensis]
MDLINTINSTLQEAQTNSTNKTSLFFQDNAQGFYCSAARLLKGDMQKLAPDFPSLRGAQLR